MSPSLKKDFQGKYRSSGFSLLEITIGLGLAALLSLFVTGILTTMTKSQLSARSSSDFYTLVNYMSSVVANDSTCIGALAGGRSAAAPIAPQVLSPPRNLIRLTPGSTTALGFYNNASPPIITVSATPPASTYGALTIKTLEVRLSAAGTPNQAVPGNTFYQATLNLVAQKPSAAFGAPTLADNKTQITVELDPGGVLIGCTGIRLNNLTNLNLPPCNPGEVAVTTGTTVTCKSSICPSGSLQVGFKPDGSADCQAAPNCSCAGAAPGTCMAGTLFLNQATKKYQCKPVVCPVNQVPSRLDSDGYIASCGGVNIVNCDPNSNYVCNYSSGSITVPVNNGNGTANIPAYTAYRTYSCPPGKTCVGNCNQVDMQPCYLGGTDAVNGPPSNNTVSSCAHSAASLSKMNGVYYCHFNATNNLCPGGWGTYGYNYTRHTCTTDQSYSGCNSSIAHGPVSSGTPLATSCAQNPSVCGSVQSNTTGFSPNPPPDPNPRWYWANTTCTNDSWGCDCAVWVCWSTCYHYSGKWNIGTCSSDYTSYCY